MFRSSSAAFSLALLACSDRAPSATPSLQSPLEAAISGELVKRYGFPIGVSCDRDRTSCTGKATGIELPIRIAKEGSALDWYVDGLVVRSDEIERYLRDELAAMGSAQTVFCGPRLRVVTAGDRVGCELGGGGKAFATIAADGSTTYEIDVDPHAGSARSETARDEELLERSRQLDVDEDGELLSDAGVPVPPGD